MLHLDELDVVAEHDVEMVGAEPVQADIDALGDALGGEVEVLEVVAAELRAERVGVARHATQRDAEQHFTHPASVEGRGVDEVQPALERHADALDGFIQGDVAELLPERRGAEAEDGQMKSGAAKGACLHVAKGLTTNRQRGKVVRSARESSFRNFTPATLIGSASGDHGSATILARAR